MAHYALLNDENIVVFVTVARDEDEHRELEISAETGQKYRRTSYNTRGGVHYQPDNNTPSENQNKAHFLRLTIFLINFSCLRFAC